VQPRSTSSGTCCCAAGDSQINRRVVGEWIAPRAPIREDPLAKQSGGLRRIPHRDLFSAVGRLEIDQQFASRGKVRDEARWGSC
jgi:hypothetical protein